MVKPVSDFNYQESFIHSLYEITVKKSSLKRYIARFKAKKNTQQ